MPLLNVKLIEGVFTPTQKKEMIRTLTDTMVAIEGENMRHVTSVVIEEVKSGDWGIGGNPLTTNDVKALAAGKPRGARQARPPSPNRPGRPARRRSQA
jgi:4-oxalocrotonate tautomerase